MARSESRGYSTLPCLAPARGGNDPGQPQQAHRPGHGLAVLERAQERVEGVILLNAILFLAHTLRTPVALTLPSPRGRGTLTLLGRGASSLLGRRRPRMLVAALLTALALPWGVFAHN